MRWIRLAPVTAESLIVCVAIFASCAFQASSNHERFDDSQRSWGAIHDLTQIVIYDGVRNQQEPELFGPFDIWDGEWWRIPITAFHHVNLLHLVLCVGAAWYLGRRLERRWGSFLTSLFLLPALFIPVMAELSFGRGVLGFSGAICSMLGALVVSRRYDRNLSEDFPAQACDIGMAIIVLGWLGTLIGVVAFPNAAHLAGFIYGAMIAWIVGSRRRNVVLLSLSIVLVNLWLLPGLLLVTRPVWLGRYHWYDALRVQTPLRAEKSIEKALMRDPSLTGAWLYWSKFAEDRQDWLMAWRRIIQGLSLNPSSLPLMDGSRRIWRHLDVSQRVDAEFVLNQLFDQRTPAWLRQIRADASTRTHELDDEARNSAETIDLNEIQLDQKLELPAVDLSPFRPDRQRLLDPIGPNDATEGETL